MLLRFRTLLRLGQNVITFRTLLHLGSFITFRPSTNAARQDCNKNSYGLFRLVCNDGLIKNS